MEPVVDVPQLLKVHASGELEGNTRVYQKHLREMTGVYRDDAAYGAAVEANGPDHLVYEVHEHKYRTGPGALIVGTSNLLPGRYGDEFAVTRGHLHAIADRAELYYCLSGHGVMLLETIDGQTQAVELRAGEAVDVPGHWIHRSVNVGDEPFVTLFCYGSDAGQDYQIIEDAGGTAALVVATDGGWTTRPNPDHVGYRAASK